MMAQCSLLFEEGSPEKWDFNTGNYCIRAKRSDGKKIWCLASKEFLEDHSYFYGKISEGKPLPSKALMKLQAHFQNLAINNRFKEADGYWKRKEFDLLLQLYNTP